MRPSSTSSELRQMRTVSRRFFPLQDTAFRMIGCEMNSQYKPHDDSVAAEELQNLHGGRVQSCHYVEGRLARSSVAFIPDIPELSSEVASSTMRRFGLLMSNVCQAKALGGLGVNIRFLWPQNCGRNVIRTWLWCSTAGVSHYDGLAWMQGYRGGGQVLAFVVNRRRASWMR